MSTPNTPPAKGKGKGKRNVSTFGGFSATSSPPPTPPGSPPPGRVAMQGGSSNPFEKLARARAPSGSFDASSPRVRLNSSNVQTVATTMTGEACSSVASDKRNPLDTRHFTRGASAHRSQSPSPASSKAFTPQMRGRMSGQTTPEGSYKSDVGSVPYPFTATPSTPPSTTANTPESKPVRFNSKPDVTEVSMATSTESGVSKFQLGGKAMAQGLVAQKHLNGQLCTVEKIDANGFLHVNFADLEGKAAKWKLAEKNLMPVMSMGDSDSEDSDLERQPSYGAEDDDADSDDEVIEAELGAIENATPVAGEAKGQSLNVEVRVSPKKTNVSSLPKIGKKVGKKAHLWAVTVGNETFYARRTALVKTRLIKKRVITPGAVKKAVVKSLQKQGQTRAIAMMRLAEKITFQEQSASLWVQMHFGALF